MNNQQITAEFVISQFEHKCSEYIEMVQDPREFVMGVMANKIIQLCDKIEYLERRLNSKENVLLGPTCKHN
jgi:hypothetical protein